MNLPSFNLFILSWSQQFMLKCFLKVLLSHRREWSGGPYWILLPVDWNARKCATGDGAGVGEHSFDCHDCQPAKVNIPKIYPRLPFLRGFCKSPLIWDGAKSPKKHPIFIKTRVQFWLIMLNLGKRWPTWFRCQGKETRARKLFL